MFGRFRNGSATGADVAEGGKLLIVVYASYCVGSALGARSMYGNKLYNK